MNVPEFLNRYRAGCLLCGILLISAFFNLWNIANQGITNTYYAAAVKSMLVNLGIVWLGVTFFSLTPLLAKIIATCLAFLWSYHGQSRYTFRSGDGK
jgi:4-amino-4-deoxy-L-arabinose transferase-like glycosyltransferase